MYLIVYQEIKLIEKWMKILYYISGSPDLLRMSETHSFSLVLDIVESCQGNAPNYNFMILCCIQDVSCFCVVILWSCEVY